MVRAGSICTVSFTGQAGVLTVADFASQLTAQLAQDAPPLIVKRSSIVAGDMLSDILRGQLINYSYSAVLVVQTTQDATNLDEIRSEIVRDVQVVTGYVPDASNATAGGDPTPTAPDSIDIFGPIAKIANGLQLDVQIVLWGLFALAAVIVIMIATGPNVPKLATIRL